MRQKSLVRAAVVAPIIGMTAVGAAHGETVQNASLTTCFLTGIKRSAKQVRDPSGCTIEHLMKCRQEHSIAQCNSVLIESLKVSNEQVYGTVVKYRVWAYPDTQARYLDLLSERDNCGTIVGHQSTQECILEKELALQHLMFMVIKKQKLPDQ